jgi:hypothetical protein
VPEPSIYDYLAKKNVAELTVEQLNLATKSTNLDPVNIEFWQGSISTIAPLHSPMGMATFPLLTQQTPLHDPRIISLQIYFLRSSMAPVRNKPQQ